MIQKKLKTALITKDFFILVTNVTIKSIIGNIGDIGEVGPGGSLIILDRKKNIFKLSQGEYITPEKLELIFLQSLFIDQIWIYGDSLQSFPICVIVPNFSVLLSWLREQQIDFEVIFFAIF